MQTGLIHALFFLSGISGLVYQVVWVREFGNVFGNTVYSAAAVSGVFLCGLGLGSYFVGRWGDRSYRRDPVGPLRAYGSFELGIAGLGLVIALVLPALLPLSAALSSYQQGPEGYFELTTASHMVRYAAAVLLLGPITFLMGGTLTLLIRYLVTQKLDLAAWQIGALFGINTLGSAVGAFLSDFALIPELGLMGTQRLAIALNGMAGLGALVLARRVGASAESAELTASPPRPIAGPESAAGKGLSLTATALCLSGVAAMGMEILWFRFLITAVGSYRSVFSLLLTVILVGICAGSLLGGFLHRRFGRSVLLYLGAQTLFVLTALSQLAFFDHNQAVLLMAELQAGYRDASAWGRLVYETWYNLRPIIGVVGIPALLMGCAFPLANGIVQRFEDQVGSRAGCLYLFNTLGNVLGSVATGFLLLPWLGMQKSAEVLAGLAILGLLPLYAIHHRDTHGERPLAERLAPAVCLVTLALGLVAWSTMPARRLLASALPLDPNREHHVMSLSEGINETLAVVDEAMQFRHLFTNGYSMSSNHPIAQRYMRLFSHFPLLQLEDPKRVLVICFGIGTTLHAASLHPSVEILEVAELSKNVIQQADYFTRSNHGILGDPRVSVFINDGRHHLLMQDDASYDLITLEPPPIASAGVSSLYSREFYELARAKLRDGGFMTQWLPAYQVSHDASLSMVRAFIDVFPDAVLLSGYLRELILVGVKNGAIEFDLELVKQRLAASRRLRRDLAEVKIRSLAALAGTFVGNARTLESATAGTPAVTDDRPIMEYSSRAGLHEMRLPSELFDVSGILEWCPDCFREGRAVDEVAGLETHLRALEACYRTDTFLEYSRLGIPLPGSDIAGDPVLDDPEVRTAIENDPYLNYVFLGPILHHPVLARRDTPCAIPPSERYRFLASPKRPPGRWRRHGH